MCIYVSKICAEGMYVSSPGWLKMWKGGGVKIVLFQTSGIQNVFSKNENNYIFVKKII